MKGNDGTFITAIVAMLCITTLAAIGMANGIDGALYWTALTIIGGLGGYSVGVRRRKGNGKPPESDKPTT